MKKIFAGIALAVVALTAAAQEDPIVMRIGGVPVTRSEFEYNYNKNNKFMLFWSLSPLQTLPAIQ